jgi:hypothetical protein
MTIDWYFLGGADLEMRTIAGLLTQAHVRCVDLGLGWGARASAYADHISLALAAGASVVMVELEWDLPVYQAELEAGRIVLIDHHNARAGADQASALRQVFNRLALPETRWTRELALIEANDIGYLPAMAAMHASKDEMRRIRALDRQAQGVSVWEEQSVRDAMDAREVLNALTILRLPHDRASVAVDFMEPLLGGPGYQNLLVLGQKEINFYGAGDWVLALHRQFPGGWYGGALPARGYWGCAAIAQSDAVMRYLRAIRY